MTSNLGARDNEHYRIGFGDLARSGEDDKALKQYFSPEFRNRLDAVIKFSALSPVVVLKIVDKFVGELNRQLADKAVTITLSVAAKQWLANKGYDRLMGARPLGRLIDTEIKSPLSRRVLFGDLSNGGVVKIDVNNNTLTFVVKPKQKKAAKKKTTAK
jgi:ATP-dependent Clp protease ATP-binding subunit ClpA